MLSVRPIDSFKRRDLSRLRRVTLWGLIMFKDLIETIVYHIRKEIEDFKKACKEVRDWLKGEPD